MMIEIIGSKFGTVKSGNPKVLAAMADKRLPLLPDVPSVAELGLPQLAGDIWFAISAPARTPPAMREKFAPLGLEMIDKMPAGMNAMVKRDGDRWRRVIKEANVKVE